MVAGGTVDVGRLAVLGAGRHGDTLECPGQPPRPQDRSSLDQNVGVTTILSIQSSVAYGHVGNSAATFPLMRMGCRGVAGADRALLQPHRVRRVARPAAGRRRRRRGGPGHRRPRRAGRVDAVLSGYQGGEDVGAVILDAVDAGAAAQPGGPLLLRPGDGRCGPRLLRAARDPRADARSGGAGGQIITPNQFELEFLTGTVDRRRLTRCCDAADARAGPGARDRAGDQRRSTTDAAPDTIDMIAVTGEGAWSVTTPLLPRTFTGAGDLTAATFLAHCCRGARCREALGRDRRGRLSACSSDRRLRAVRAAAGGRPGRDRRAHAHVRGQPAALSRTSRAAFQSKSRMHGAPTTLRSRAPKSARTCCPARAAGDSSVPEDLDVGAERVEPVGQVLVAAVDHVDVAQHRLARARPACRAGCRPPGAAPAGRRPAGRASGSGPRR